MPHPDHDAAGFSLMEALVAVAILSLGFTAAMSVFSAGSQRQARIDTRLAQQLHAQALMDAVLADAHDPARLSGPDWAIAITPAPAGLRHIRVEAGGFALETLAWPGAAP